MSAFEDSEFHEQQAISDGLKNATRASIVAFITAERQKFERAYNEHIAAERPANDEYTEYDLKTCRLDSKVSILRTLIAYIERGDDMGPR